MWLIECEVKKKRGKKSWRKMKEENQIEAKKYRDEKKKMENGQKEKGERVRLRECERKKGNERE